MKNLRIRLLAITLSCFIVTIIFSACQKDNTSENDNSTRTLSVFLTDDPCNFDSVFIDIRTVEVKIDSSRKHDDDDNGNDDNDDDGDDNNSHHDSFGRWDTLTIRPGVYNILKLRNGIDTLLATGNIPAKKIKKIRITLGTNNRIVVGGNNFPLALLAGTSKYVYVKIKKEHQDDNAGNQTSIWLDFDVCESIKFRNGAYFLKPFLKVFCQNNFGKVEGKVLPRIAQPFVKIFNATDSATAIPENDGEYKIRGLREGTYKIRFSGSNGYLDTTISNIQIRKGKETEIPTITLHN
jgi:hypothetical protein